MADLFLLGQTLHRLFQLLTISSFLIGKSGHLLCELHGPANQAGQVASLISRLAAPDSDQSKDLGQSRQRREFILRRLVPGLLRGLLNRNEVHLRRSSVVLSYIVIGPIKELPGGRETELL